MPRVMNSDGGSMPKRRRRMEKQRHIYLVLDDWSWGYGIRKIDLLSDNPCELKGFRSITSEGEGGISYTRLQKLPSAFFRLEAERGMPHYFAGAFDSKILALQPVVNSGMNRKPMDAVPVFDVRMRSFMFSPRRWPEPVNPIYIPVGGRLFALADGSFELLYPPPRDEFSWDNFVWAWNKLPELPFRSEHVTSYAVHPDGQTIFVSIEDCAGNMMGSTLSCNTTEQVIRNGCQWKQHGHWQLPFAGQASFDPELEAWVGLSNDAYGCICSCDISSANFEQCPPLKLSREKLFDKAPHEHHLGAKLVYLGSGSKFCLLEYLAISAELTEVLTDPDEGNMITRGSRVLASEADSEGDWKPILRLTLFSLKRDKKGELTTGNSCRLHYYSLPEEATNRMVAEEPVAFWM